MDNFFFVLPVVGMLAIGGGILGLVLYFDKKRREAWMAVAQQLGFTYERKQSGVSRGFGYFKIFSLGYSKGCKNILSGPFRSQEATLMDYQYTTGGGKNRSTHRQTLCVLKNPEIDVPHCFLRRQSKVFDFLGKVFGGQDIDYDEDPEFSKTFVLQGENEAATRRLFDLRLRQRFMKLAQTNLQVEIRGNTLLIHKGRTLKPEDANTLLQQAHEIMGYFR